MLPLLDTLSATNYTLDVENKREISKGAAIKVHRSEKVASK